MFAISPQAAYHLSELIEDHAYHTYDAFLHRKGDELKLMPVPEVARRYYEEDNPFLCASTISSRDPCRSGARPPFMQARHVRPPTLPALPAGGGRFDLLCTMSGCVSEPLPAQIRRPKLESLYDVFWNVRNDEKEHWATLCNLVQHDTLDADGKTVGSSKPMPLHSTDDESAPFKELERQLSSALGERGLALPRLLRRPAAPSSKCDEGE